MEIRNAKVTDAMGIHELIRQYSELERMLFRPVTDIYENLQLFVVAVEKDQVIGCCALQVVWMDLAEIKSLAVSQTHSGMGVGRSLVKYAINNASELGITKVFTLTLEPMFFEKQGFSIVEKDTLPMKVWSDCARCSKQDHCDEVAMLLNIGPSS